MQKDGQQGCQQCGKSAEGLAGVSSGDKPEQSRRSLLSWLLGGGVAASLISFLYPVIHFLNPPHISEAAVDEVSGGKVEDLKPNSGKIVKFGSKPALLVRVSDTEWKALSAVCTHLNCTVQYQTLDAADLVRLPQRHVRPNGRVVSGPPPKPLEEYRGEGARRRSCDLAPGLMQRMSIDFHGSESESGQLAGRKAGPQRGPRV